MLAVDVHSELYRVFKGAGTEIALDIFSPNQPERTRCGVLKDQFGTFPRTVQGVRPRPTDPSEA